MTEPLRRLVGAAELRARSRLVGDPLFPTTAAFYAPSEVRLTEGGILWRFGEGHEIRTRGMLDGFTAIRDAEGALAFARRWGVLGLCVHGLPRMHPPLDDRGFPCDQPIAYDDWHVEPIEWWLSYVSTFRALLSIGAKVQLGEVPGEEYWDGVFDSRVSEWTDDEWSRIEHHREALASEIDKWMSVGWVRPHFDWSEDSPRLSLEGPTFGLLAVQLMFAVSASNSLDVCANCGRAHLRRRKSHAKGQAYCDLEDCQRAAGRDRQRRSRARKALAGE